MSLNLPYAVRSCTLPTLPPPLLPRFLPRDLPQANLEFHTVDIQGFVTANDDAMHRLFRENIDQGDYELLINDIATRLATVFASLKASGCLEPCGEDVRESRPGRRLSSLFHMRARLDFMPSLGEGGESD